MAERELVSTVMRRMPAPGQNEDMNFLIVLAREARFLGAFIGAGTDPTWVAANGRLIAREEAVGFFPDLPYELRRRGLSYGAI